jgi:hypothetical protein
MVAKKIKCKRILLKSNENKKKEIENKSNIIYIYDGGATCTPLERKRVKG